MKIIRTLDTVQPDLQDCIMTIGNFDGIHLAHQKIIRKVVEEARKINRRGVVMTFEPHPQKVLHADQIPFYLILTFEEKMAVLESLGVDVAIIIEFTRAFAKTTADEFIRNVICEKIRPREVLIGHDYTFGKGKEGKPEYLRSLGRQCGFDVEVIEAFRLDGDIVSSTRVRHMILKGDVAEAAYLLGRSFNLRGTVVRGFQRGSEIGFPTANLQPDKELMPAEGVYAVFVEVDGEKHPAVVNIGYNPTFANESLSVEIHLLNFKEDLYGRLLNVLFVDRLRGERKFESAEELAEQIKADIVRAREILQA